MQPSGTEPGSQIYPYVTTTYRLTEHHTAGGMSRWLPYLAELQPEFFCEVSPALAAERGLEHLGWATIISARSAVEARVLVTERMTPLTVRGRILHQVGLPYHWGGNGYSTGDSANDLAPVASTRTCTFRRSRHSPAISGRAAGRGARRGWNSSVTTSGGPGSPSKPGWRCDMTHGRAGWACRSCCARASPAPRPATRLYHRTTAPHRGSGSSPTPRLHRLQGVRGRLQGVEPRSRGRSDADRHVL